MRRAPAKKPFNLILLGDPASGKGTQAARLVKKYHFYNLDMGHEVRKPAALAQYDYAKTTARGHLTPTGVVRNIFKRVIAKTPARQGILFNGTPKMINEARLVARELARAGRTDTLFIYLSISKDEMFKRAGLRKIYINGKLIKRDDDSHKALLNRKRYYQEQVVHVVKFFKERYDFRRISGMGTEATVRARINAAIREYHGAYHK